MPRILVLSASVGAGHLRAAQAVELALRRLSPGSEIRNIDILELTNATFRRLYGNAYLDLVNHAPHVLGLFYDLMDQPRGPASRRDQFRLLVEKLNLRSFEDLLRAEPWDVIVNTHFLPAEIVASLKRKRKLTVPHITVTTDFATHRLWVNQPCEWYCTATQEGAEYLKSFGARADRIRVTGIPIHPVFAEPKDRARCRAAHGLAEDRPVILQVAGGFGVGPIHKLFEGLLAVQTPIHLVTVAGKNAKAKAELESLAPPPRHRVKVLGFTDKIDELMAAADVVVSKPGGLTSSETLARGAALAIVNPIPGQESRNSDYLLENGAAIKINNIATLPFKMDELLKDKKKLDALQANARRIAKPQAAFTVAELALSQIGG